MKRGLFFCLMILLILAGCTPAPTPAPTSVPPTVAPTKTPEPSPTATPIPPTPTPLPPMSLASGAFDADGEIPLRHAQKPFRVQRPDGAWFLCTGQEAEKEDLSPAMSWENVPLDTVTLALVMVDKFNMDLPVEKSYVHWVIYNILPAATGLPEGLPAETTLPDGSMQGENHYPAPYNIGYGGPCPPEGEEHTYYFVLYALDTTLDLSSGAAPKDFFAAITDHVLAEAELQARYTGR